MEKNVQLVLDFIREMKEFRFNSIDRLGDSGIYSCAEAYSYGYDKGSLADLDFLKTFLNRYNYEKS